jgi:hypothetical protein
MYRDQTVEVAYVPFDWVNTSARIALVGICPGRHQAWVATMEARRALRDGATYEDALRRADSKGSFSGSMRANLVSMLDAIDVARSLSIGSTAELFSDAQALSAHLSAIMYPVFIRGENYGGSAPPIDRDRALRSLVRQTLGTSLSLIPEALVVPLGNAARKAVEMLVRDGVLTASRCLLGFPHPSGANGWRVRHFTERQAELTIRVNEWFSLGDPQRSSQCSSQNIGR